VKEADRIDFTAAIPNQGKPNNAMHPGRRVGRFENGKLSPPPGDVDRSTCYSLKGKKTNNRIVLSAGRLTKKALWQSRIRERPL
jgi:hypothetical protein